MFTVTDGIIYTKDGKIYGPASEQIRTQIIREHHDTPLNGHLGEHKTLERVMRQYFWPSMRRKVQPYIQQCHSCQANKGSNQLPIGLLQSIDIPGKRWET